MVRRGDRGPGAAARDAILAPVTEAPDREDDDEEEEDKEAPDEKLVIDESLSLSLSSMGTGTGFFLGFVVGAGWRAGTGSGSA